VTSPHLVFVKLKLKKSFPACYCVGFSGKAVSLCPSNADADEDVGVPSEKFCSCLLLRALHYLMRAASEAWALGDSRRLKFGSGEDADPPSGSARGVFRGLRRGGGLRGDVEILKLLCVPRGSVSEKAPTERRPPKVVWEPIRLGKFRLLSVGLANGGGGACRE